MSIFEELYPGSFRGVPFLLQSATTDFGRKQVKHEYPNSDRQKIQDLGLKPRVFRMTVQVSGPTTLDARSYSQKKSDLLTALEREGSGTLSHPFFATSFEVVARPGTLTERMTEAGIATFDLTFDISDRETDPQPSATSLSQINQALNNVNAETNADIAENWGVSTSLNLEAAEALLNDFIENIEETTNTFNKQEDQNNVFAGLIGEFQDNIPDLIQSGQDLADSVGAVIGASSGLYQTTEEAIQVFVRFFGYGDDFNEPPNTTDERAERNSNNQLISDATQVSYLSLCYQFAAQTEFTTVDDITDLQDTLEEQYQKLINDDAKTDTGLALNELRVLANQFLEEQRLNASQVIEVETRENSLSLIAFQYYGDIDNLQDITDTLVDLNRTKSNDVTFVEGEIDILTQ